MKHKDKDEYMTGHWWPEVTTDLWNAKRFKYKEDIAAQFAKDPFVDKKLFADFEPVEIEIKVKS